MNNNNNSTEFKCDNNLALELAYIEIIGKWLKYAKENRTCVNPINSKEDLSCMLDDFFIKPKFAFYKSQAVYTTLTGILKKPFMDWKIADDKWFTKLDRYYKKLLINSKLQQLEGDFTNG
jgi:hypothetical protein